MNASRCHGQTWPALRVPAAGGKGECAGRPFTDINKVSLVRNIVIGEKWDSREIQDKKSWFTVAKIYVFFLYRSSN